MGTERSRCPGWPDKSAIRRERERRILRIAGRQQRLVTLRQLGDCGFSRSTVGDRVAARRLHRTPFRGVYSLNPPPLGRLQTWRAALLACGHESVASHWTACGVLQIAEVGVLPVHVTSRCRGRSRSQIVLHRSIVLPRDTAGRDGVLCTSAARTILDLAGLAGRDQLERMLIAADSLRILNRRRLQELVDQSPGRRGVRVLRSLLAADPVRVRSDAETEMLFACRLAGLPDPVVNGRVGGIEVDLHWPELRLVVEVDGWAFHGGRERMNRDRDRDQRLLLAGWRVIRFTRDQLASDPAQCARRLAALSGRPRSSDAPGRSAPSP